MGYEKSCVGIFYVSVLYYILSCTSYMYEVSAKSFGPPRADYKHVELTTSIDVLQQQDIYMNNIIL